MSSPNPEVGDRSFGSIDRVNCNISCKAKNDHPIAEVAVSMSGLSDPAGPGIHFSSSKIRNRLDSKIT
jgi:hypothetical protein